MKITLFTSNQPRHLSLIEALSQIASKLFVVMETNTIFPGQVKGFYATTPNMKQYFKQVIEAEKNIFGLPRFLPSDVNTMVIQTNDLGNVSLPMLQSALNSDLYIVFGSSYIKGELCEYLIKHRAVNIHMGISPYYRGSSCNFWALYDHHPEYVGGTVHYLSKGLDSGAILFHALPPTLPVNGFMLGMLAVKTAILGLKTHIRNGALLKLKPVRQDKKKEIRYSRYGDYTETVVNNYLSSLSTPKNIQLALSRRNLADYIHPFLT